MHCGPPNQIFGWAMAPGPRCSAPHVMAISVGDEYETYESFKCKIEEIPTYSVKLIRKLVTI